VPRHGIGQQVQRSSAGSIPHDRITTLQICSSRSLPLNRPRQSASRHPPLVTNRPTTYRVRRDPRLIQQPFHHPPACWSPSTPFTHFIRGTQIPIAQAATPTSPSRGFLPWRFAYAGPPCTPRHLHGAAIRTKAGVGIVLVPSEPAEPVVSVGLPVSTGKIIAYFDITNVLRILEPELRRYA